MGPLIIMFTRVLRVDGIASLWRFVGNLSFKGFLKLQNIFSQLARWYALGIKDVSSLRKAYKMSLIAVPSQELPANFSAIPIHHCAGLCSPPLTTHHQ